MISTTDQRFLNLHPKLLAALRGDEQRLRSVVTAGVAACTEEAPAAVKYSLSRMLTIFGEGLIVEVFEGLLTTFAVMSEVIRSQEPRAPKPTDIN